MVAGAVAKGGASALPELREHRVDQVGALVQRLARDREHQLRVARRAVVVHSELARVDAALAQRHALGVPERHDGVDPPGDQARHGREADRNAPDALEVAAVVLDDGAQDGVVRGQPGHAHPATLEVARAPHLRAARDHGRQRSLHQRADADDVAPALAREPEVVDVHHRHVGAAGGEQLQRVRARGRHADAEVLGRVDAGMHRVRLEVERQRPALGAAAAVVSTAAREAREQHKQGKESAHGGEQ